MEQETADAVATPSLEERLGDRLFGPDEPGDESEETQPVAEEATADEAESQEAPAETEPEATPEAETTWVDIDGKRIEGVPKPVAELAIEGRQARKERADFDAQRKSFDSYVQQTQLQQKFLQSVSKETQQIAGWNAQIEQYKGLDWASLDTDTMVRARHAMDMIRDQISATQAELNAKQQEFNKYADEQRQLAAKSAYDAISRQVPGFAPESEIERNVASYAAKAGIPIEGFVAGSIMYPGLAVMTHKAMQWDALQANKGAATKKASAAPPMVKPGAVDPNMSQKMRDLNELGQIKRAKGPIERNKLLQARLERKFFGD